MQSDGTCACDIGYYVVVDACIEATVECSTGQYNNGEDVCTDCGENCDVCEDFTGECTTCADEMTVNAFDNTRCGTCAYPVGPADAPT